MFASDDGGSLLVATDDDRLWTLDTTPAEVGNTIDGRRDRPVRPGGTGPRRRRRQGSVADPAAAAATLADLLGGDAEPTSSAERRDGGTFVAGIGGADQKANVDAAIDDGRLAGLAVQDAARVAIATSTGVMFDAAPTGDVVTSVEVDGGAFGLALVTGIDDPKLYVPPSGDRRRRPGEVATIVVGGDAAKNGPIAPENDALPGRGSTVLYDEASQMVHVLGVQPDGEGSTIYVIEPHANAVFADSPLPFDPVAVVMDAAQMYPTDDRQQILAFDAGGDVASVEVGQHAFAWRVPGVLAGALMAACSTSSPGSCSAGARSRSSSGSLVLVDGMLFVQSRIGMNDAYVALGIVAAYTLFAALWMGYWRWRGRSGS